MFDPNRLFSLDPTNKNDVCELAKELGRGWTVFRRPNSKVWNITHTWKDKSKRVKSTRYEGCEIALQT